MANQSTPVPGISDDGMMDELRMELVQELSQNLGDWEETILVFDRPVSQAEDTQVRSEAIAQAFRIAHSIKGTCAALGFTHVSHFGHAVEDCLTLIRNQNDLVSPVVSSILLRSGDEFKRAVKYIDERREQEWSAGTLLNEVQNLTRSLQERAQISSASKVEASGLQGGAFDLELTREPGPTGVNVEPPSSEATGGGAAASAVGSASGGLSASATGGQSSGVPGKTAESIRMDPARLESLLDLVGELVVIKSQILMEFGESSRTQMRANSLLTLFDRTVRDLQDRALGMRMTSLKPLFTRLRRVVRDTSSKLDKPVDFEVIGEDMEIDRSMIELLADPLMHIVRNSLDHGIERVEQRVEALKPEKARVEVRAERRGGRLELTIEDDGKGIDRKRILARARERGIVPPLMTDDRLSDQDVFEFLFAPGFSTAEKVTDISGRGVGLDVVRSNVQKMKGTVDVRSTLGKGTTFRLSLPLTTAITDGIIVHSRGVRMVLPLEGVREFVCLGDESRCSIDPEHDAVRIRDEVLPLVNLSVLFPIAHHVGVSVQDHSGSSLEARRRKCGSLVVVENMGEACAIEIDGIMGQAQVVTKPLPLVVALETGVSGTAVMGDGVIALVLDVASLPRSLARAKAQVVSILSMSEQTRAA